MMEPTLLDHCQIQKNMRITLKMKVADALGVKEGDHVGFYLTDDGEVIIAKTKVCRVEL